jgi:uncharacterized membrane protein YczE
MNIFMPIWARDIVGGVLALVLIGTSIFWMAQTMNPDNSFWRYAALSIATFIVGYCFYAELPRQFFGGPHAIDEDLDEEI